MSYRFTAGDLVEEKATGARMTVKITEHGSWSGMQILICLPRGASRPTAYYANEMALVRKASPCARKEGET